MTVEALTYETVQKPANQLKFPSEGTLSTPNLKLGTGVEPDTDVSVRNFNKEEENPKETCTKKPEKSLPTVQSYQHRRLGSRNFQCSIEKNACWLDPVVHILCAPYMTHKI